MAEDPECSRDRQKWEGRGRSGEAKGISEAGVGTWHEQPAPDATLSRVCQQAPFISLNLHKLVQIQENPLEIEGLVEGDGKGK